MASPLLTFLNPSGGQSRSPILDFLNLVKTRAAEKAGNVANVAFTRPPGHFGPLDPGSLIGSYQQAPKTPQGQQQFALDTILGFAGGVKANPQPKLNVGKGLFSTQRFNLPTELDDFVRTTSKGIDKDIQYARRGVVDWAKTLKDAEKITTAQILERSRGKGVNDSYIAAAAGHVKDVTEEISKLVAQAKQLEVRGVDSQALKNEIGRQTALYKALLSQTFGASAESGRALAAHKIIAKNLLQPRDVLIKDVLKNASAYKNVDSVVGQLMKFAPEDKMGMIKFLTEVNPASPMDKIQSVWYNNILSGTSTHLANTMGNTGRTLWQLATKPLRVGVDVVASKVSGQPREEFLKEFGPEAVGATKGFKDGVRRALFSLKTGLRESDIENLTVPQQALKGKIGSIYSTPSKALVAGDELFRGINRSMEIYRGAFSKAVKEGLTGKELEERAAELINAPTPEMIKRADEVATELLFQKGSDELRAVGGLRDMFSFDIPKLGTVRPLRFVIPFIQTPLNVAKFGLEASPLGVVKTLAQSKSLNRLDLNRQLASGVLGTGTLAALAMYATEDKIIGAAPRPQKEKDAFYATGKQPYSVKIGNQWVQYSRLPEPFSTLLSGIAAWHDNFKNKGEIPNLQTIGKVAATIGRNYTDKTFLSGVGDLLNAIEDPETYGNTYLQRLASSSVVPFSSLTGSVARATDRVVRKPEDLLQAIQTQIPGLSQSVPARSSVFEEGGQAVRKAPAWQEFVPVKTTQEQPNSGAQEYLNQRSTITTGKPHVLELLKESDLYKKASPQQQAKLEEGVQASYSRAVTAGKEDRWSLDNYLVNQKALDIHGRRRKKRF